MGLDYLDLYSKNEVHKTKTKNSFNFVKSMDQTGETIGVEGEREEGSPWKCQAQK